jgi:hypothetical protein
MHSKAGGGALEFNRNWNKADVLQAADDQYWPMAQSAGC